MERVLNSIDVSDSKFASNPKYTEFKMESACLVLFKVYNHSVLHRIGDAFKCEESAKLKKVKCLKMSRLRGFCEILRDF